MRTSKQWWDAIKTDDSALIGWLQKQYHGEVTAADRIEKYALSRAGADFTRDTLSLIAEQERTHASWVGDLLRARGVEPRVLDKDERYWDRVVGAIDSLESAAAVAAHAEVMRLERIRVICEDASAPADIRDVFSRILPQEMFHADAFAVIAGKPAVEAARTGHLAGAEAIGFVTAHEAL